MEGVTRDAKRGRERRSDNVGSLPLSSDLEADLPEVSLWRQNQGGKGRERLEGVEVGAGSIPAG